MNGTPDTSCKKKPSINPQPLSPEALGSGDFLERYGIKYAYASGGMYKGIASVDLVIAMAKARLMSFFGAGGLTQDIVERSIVEIKNALDHGHSFGVNLLPDYKNPQQELERVKLLLKHQVRFIEAAAYMSITPALVLYCLKGIHRNSAGKLVAPNTILAKISHPKVAEIFLQPAPAAIVEKLVEQAYLTKSEAALAQYVPIAKDICVEADSGGHTDSGNPSVIFPAIKRLAIYAQSYHRYLQPIGVGLAGGIGSPDSALAAFMLGADFIMTGSINQCTPEAGTSIAVKDLLQAMDVYDTSYAPAGDMFETGAKVQVLKRGVLFAARANKLYQIYLQYPSLDSLPKSVQDQIKKILFNQSIETIWVKVESYLAKTKPQHLQRVKNNPKQKMAAVFRWYFMETTRLALEGDCHKQVDFQIHTGPALGDFNQWLKGGDYEAWQTRHVAMIAELLMNSCAELVSQRLEKLKQTQKVANFA